MEPSVFGESFLWRTLLKGVRRLQFLHAWATEKLSSLNRWLLVVLLFACIFMPRFEAGSVTAFYRIDFRLEDLLLTMLGLLLLVRMTQARSLPEIPAVEKTFLWFLLALQISIVNGLVFRTIDKPVLSFFYLLKWVEYFLVFVVTCRVTTSEEAASFFLKTFFLLGIAVACFGYWEHFFPMSKATYPNYYRLFERPPFHGDANHIGGLLVIWMGLVTGLFLKAQKRLIQVGLLASLVWVFFPLIWTYSRKSYFALAGAFAFAFVFRGVRKRLLFLTSFLVILSLALPTRFSERLTDLGEAFGSVDPFHSSWATNWVMWKQALWNFQSFFLFGSGLGSRHRLFYESQYILILTESGIFGALTFTFLGFSLIRQAVKALHARLGKQTEGLALGWLIAFVGLLIHDFSCVSLTVSKIAIPFWFLTGFTLSRFKSLRGILS